uniref:Uncharacterized protein n=1 Tax=Triticum urartu TaxID=4572 RepID=A0A8R7UQH8_TRIUA
MRSSQGQKTASPGSGCVDVRSRPGRERGKRAAAIFRLLLPVCKLFSLPLLRCGNSGSLCNRIVYPCLVAWLLRGSSNNVWLCKGIVFYFSNYLLGIHRHILVKFYYMFILAYLQKS